MGYALSLLVLHDCSGGDSCGVDVDGSESEELSVHCSRFPVSKWCLLSGYIQQQFPATFSCLVALGLRVFQDVMKLSAVMDNTRIIEYGLRRSDREVL